MNISREVVTDLLPVYFSGEASVDTRNLIEDYFRGDPDFERIARSAATPLETLRGAVALRPDAEREKRDLECVRGELSRRKVMFGVALFLTLAPLAFSFTNGHIKWLMVRDNPWDAGFYWSVAAFVWFLYFVRLGRRARRLAWPIFYTCGFVLLAFYLAFHGLKSSGAEIFATVYGILAALFWAWYFFLFLSHRHR
jgi:hypothetical protein